jgi:hypothetical protein
VICLFNQLDSMNSSSPITTSLHLLLFSPERIQIGSGNSIHI